MFYAAFTTLALAYTVVASVQLNRFGVTPRRIAIVVLSAASLAAGSWLSWLRPPTYGSAGAGVLLLGSLNAALLLWGVSRDRALWSRRRHRRRRAAH